MKKLFLIFLWALAAGCVATTPITPLHCVAVEHLDNGETWEIWQRADGSRYVKVISTSGKISYIEIVYLDEPER